MDRMCRLRCSPRWKHLPQFSTWHTYIRESIAAAPLVLVLLPFPVVVESSFVGTRRPRLFLVRFGTGTGRFAWVLGVVSRREVSSGDVTGRGDGLRAARSGDESDSESGWCFWLFLVLRPGGRGEGGGELSSRCRRLGTRPVWERVIGLWGDGVGSGGGVIAGGSGA